MVRGDQVNKIVEIIGLEIYCRTFHGTMDLMTLENSGNSKLRGNEESGGKNCDSLLAPCDVSLSLLVWKFDLQSFIHYIFVHFVFLGHSCNLDFRRLFLALWFVCRMTYCWTCICLGGFRYPCSPVVLFFVGYVPLKWF